MGKDTKIEWSDSTLNLQMGCDGCELWNGQSRACYAGTLTERYAGMNGWPKSFNEPAIFPARLQAAIKWLDLTGKKRIAKPWLSGLPRQVFLNDMGDTFTESLPVDWMEQFFPVMHESPHWWMILTKRPRRVLEFCETFQDSMPANFWFGTSITTGPTAGRAKILSQITSRPLFLSIEPLWSDIYIPPQVLEKFKLVILGGESGAQPKPTHLEWFEKIIAQCREVGTAVFVKQVGGNPFYRGAPLVTGDPKGGTPADWPESIRLREFPDPRFA